MSHFEWRKDDFQHDFPFEEVGFMHAPVEYQYMKEVVFILGGSKSLGEEKIH